MTVSLKHPDKRVNELGAIRYRGVIYTALAEGEDDEFIISFQTGMGRSDFYLSREELKDLVRDLEEQLEK